MGLFSSLFGPRPAFRYATGNDAITLTAQQYGERCIDWGTSLADVQVAIVLGAMGNYRDQEDLIVKIEQSPAPATLHARALFVAAYLTFPVFELKVSQDIFADITQGVAAKINSGLILQNIDGKNRLATADYLATLRDGIGDYSSLILASRHMSNGHVFQVALDYANAGLLEKLEYAYSEIALKPREIIEKKNSGVSIFSREFKNPSLDRTRSIDAKTLITNALTGAISQHLGNWKSKNVLTAF